MRVFEVNDIEWWIGESAEAVLAEYMKETGCSREESLGDDDPEALPQEVSEEGLDKLTFHDDDGQVRTFRKQLARDIADGVDKPRAFASTEY